MKIKNNFSSKSPSNYTSNSLERFDLFKIKEQSGSLEEIKEKVEKSVEKKSGKHNLSYQLDVSSSL